MIHESYHALQAQEAGRGFGPFSPFLILYFAAGAANRFRYRGHPMEEGAYGLAGRRRSRFESSFGHWEADHAALERDCGCMAAESSGLRFWHDLRCSTPLGRWLVPLWLVLWTGAAGLAWLGRLLVEAGGGCVAGALRLAGAGASRIRRALGAAEI